MKKSLTLTAVVVSVFCIVLFAGAMSVQAADKETMIENGQMMMDNGQMMIDKGKVMYSKGMKTEGNLMMRDGKLLLRHGKDMKTAGMAGKKLMKENYEPEKEFKGWQETEGDGG